MSDRYPKHLVTAAVLAGGRATRMGGQDKGLIELEPGSPMISYVVTALQPQVQAVMINANRHLDQYAKYANTVVMDATPGFQGPLAGIAACLKVCPTPYLLTAPCDCPLVAPDLCSRLFEGLAAEHTDIAIPFDGRRVQPAFSLMKTTLLASAGEFLEAGDRKLELWSQHLQRAIVDFSDRADTFININTPRELDALKARNVL